MMAWHPLFGKKPIYKIYTKSDFFDWVDEPRHVFRCEGDEDAVDA